MKKRVSIIAAVIATCATLVTPTQAFAAPKTINSGDRITINYDSGYRAYCTLTGVAIDESGALYGVTAAHCIRKRGGTIPSSVTINNVQIANRDSMNEAHTVIKHERIGQGVTDMALFRLNDGIGTSGVIGTTNIPVSGTGRVSDLKPGQEICKYGAVTGNTCGNVTAINNQYDDIYANILALHGDSGSPFYTVEEDGSGRIYGALSGGPNDYDNYADAVGNNLDQWGVQMGNDVVPQSPANPPSDHSSSSSTSGSSDSVPVEKEPLSSIGLSSEAELSSRIDELATATSSIAEGMSSVAEGVSSLSSEPWSALSSSR